MRRVNVHKARGIGDVAPDAITVVVADAFPEFLDEPESERSDLAASQFRRDALDLVDALCGTLPGGTLDQVLIELLRRKASQLVVRS